jgi:hypothetical protein
VILGTIIHPFSIALKATIGCKEDAPVILLICFVRGIVHLLTDNHMTVVGQITGIILVYNDTNIYSMGFEILSHGTGTCFQCGIAGS